MKKTLWMIGALCLSSLFSFAVAQDSEIGNISVKFCNNEIQEKTLNLIADTETDYDICMDFSNSTNHPITIKYGFVDGVLTNDSLQNRACTNDTMTNFGQYVTQTERYVQIPARGTVKQTASVNFPAGMAGTVNGCLVYSIFTENSLSNNIEQSDESATTFDIVVRKASFINALVGGEIERNIVQDQIRVYFDGFINGNEHIEIPFTNKGNIDEKVSFSGTFSNIFGYSHDLTGFKLVNNGASQTIEMIVDDLPWYKCFFKIKGTLTSENNVTFNTDLLPDNAKQTNEMPVEISVFIFPRLLLIIVIAAILLAWGIRYLSKHLTFHK